MPRSTFMRTVLAALGGLLGAVLMLGILAIANGGAGFAYCTATTGFGWIVPLVGGLAIGAVSLLLLDSGNDNRSNQTPDLRSSACTSCGNPILDEWRLCPHCGQLLECRVSVTSTVQTTNGA